jgi:tetratricopeptide (TPR) repeat protein
VTDRSDAARLETLKRAEALADAACLEEALALCEAVLRDATDSAAALNLKGFCLAGLGRPADALEAFRLARFHLPVYAPIRFNFARALEETGQPEAALEEYGAALALDPEDARARLCRGLLRLARGAHEAAGEDLAHALGDNGARLARLVAAGEAAYAKMYEAAAARGPYADAKDAFADAIGLAERLGLHDEARRLDARRAHIKAVYRSQFDGV